MRPNFSFFLLCFSTATASTPDAASRPCASCCDGEGQDGSAGARKEGGGEGEGEEDGDLCDWEGHGGEAGAPEAICNSLGRIWSPIHGVDCKDLGENRFMFIFKQEREKRKALEDGTWMFDNALVVMEEFNPSK